MLAGATTAVAVAQEGGTAAPDIGNSGLRTDPGLDLSRDLRSDALRPLSPPVAISRDQTPYEQLDRGPDARAGGTNDDPDTPDEERKAVPAHSKTDLFDGPEPRRQARQNDPARPAEPGGVFGDPAGARSSVSRRSRRDTTASTVGRSLRPDGRLLAERVSLPSGPVRHARIGTVGDRLNLRTAPLRGMFPVSSDDPFAPVGVRLDGFVLYAALDQSLGLSSNLDEIPKAKGGAFSDTALSARFRSDWSRHSAELNALANYRRNFAGEERSDPDLNVDGSLRFDVDRLTAATLRGGFTYRKEEAEDLDSLAEGTERPDLLNYAAGADLDRQFGRASARASVSAVRETTSDRPGAVSVLDENFNTYTVGLRAGYQISQAFSPFVEGGVGRRIFDGSRDFPGLERNSVIESLRAGIAFDLGEKLRGEVAAGYGWNVPDAHELGIVGSPTLDARLAWSPQRGTDVALTASTTFDPDPVGSATATLYEAGVAARHRATARLDLDAAVTAGYRDSQLDTDVERTLGTSAGFTYWLSRSLAVIGLASHDRVNRVNGPGDYEVSAVKLGIRLQN